MAVAIGIWGVLLGYTVAWAGWRNLGISYTPQSDGSVVPSQPPVTLLDAFTCRTPQSQPAAAQPGSPAPPTPTSTPAPVPNPVPAPQPVPTPGGIWAPIAIPRPIPKPLPGFPHPPSGVPVPGGLAGIVTSIGAGLRSLLQPFAAGLRL